MKNKLNIKFSKILFVFLFVESVLIGCVPVGRQEIVPDVPEDIPLSEFIVGYWKSVKVIRGDKEETKEGSYELEFIDSDTLKFVINNDDGETTQYSFIDSNKIFVDSKRILGGEQWQLERIGQTLMVHRVISDTTIHIAFERQYGRMR